MASKPQNSGKKPTLESYIEADKHYYEFKLFRDLNDEGGIKRHSRLPDDAKELARHIAGMTEEDGPAGKQQFHRYWPASIKFASPRPTHLSHWFHVNQVYDISAARKKSEAKLLAIQGTLASPQWKAAIETMEPGIHQFIPVNIELSDATVEGYSWFVTRQFLAPPVHENNPDRYRNDFVSTTTGTPTRLCVQLGEQDRSSMRYLAKKGMFSGTHWAFTEYRLISGALLLKLLPLILPRERKALCFTEIETIPEIKKTLLLPG